MRYQYIIYLFTISFEKGKNTIRDGNNFVEKSFLYFTKFKLKLHADCCRGEDFFFSNAIRINYPTWGGKGISSYTHYLSQKKKDQKPDASCQLLQR
jgi:hypothetical protein